MAELSIEDRIYQVLAEVRPFLQEDGGDLEFVRYEPDTRVAEIRLLGACKNCPMQLMTLRAGIERFLIKAIPEIRRIESVQ
jgi:Fe-S cluster biogenesis protein NfuA